jgi:hypothetical protein
VDSMASWLAKITGMVSSMVMVVENEGMVDILLVSG